MAHRPCTSRALSRVCTLASRAAAERVTSLSSRNVSVALQSERSARTHVMYSSRSRELSLVSEMTESTTTSISGIGSAFVTRSAHVIVPSDVHHSSVTATAETTTRVVISVVLSGTSSPSTSPRSESSDVPRESEVARLARLARLSTDARENAGPRATDARTAPR